MPLNIEIDAFAEDISDKEQNEVLSNSSLWPFLDTDFHMLAPRFEKLHKNYARKEKLDAKARRTIQDPRQSAAKSPRQRTGL